MFVMSIRHNLRIKSENDLIFSNGEWDMKSRFIEDFTPVPMKRETPFALSESVRRLTTVGCILENRSRRVIALNFANALFAGGAYRMGGNAQEESICRASLLYYTIRGEKEFYSNNRRCFSALYTDGMIFSENVPIIRGEDGALLDTRITADFITCPAVNLRELMPWQRKRADEVMERRIGKIVSFMQSREPDVIVLGAFGCGAYGNKRETVLPFFEKAINMYTDGNAEIIFAIP